MSGDSAGDRWNVRLAAAVQRPSVLGTLGAVALVLPLLVLATAAPADNPTTTPRAESAAALARHMSAHRPTPPPDPAVTLPPSTVPATTAPPSTVPPFPRAATPATTSTTTSTVVAPTSTGVIGSSGGHLELDGHPYTFIGVDAYELATEWGVNQGCGPMLTDVQMNAFFASLPPNSLVRFWAFQGSMAVNIDTHQIDWAPLDRVFAAAAAHDQRLIVVLTSQSGGCDDGQWKDPAWYKGGFEQVYNPTGMTPLSYWDYVQEIVDRYKSSPALGMWEPISEAEASTCPAQDEPSNCSGNQTCPDEAAATQALRHFFDIVGGEIHSLDPTHLVEQGLISSGQCGAINTDFVSVSESPGVDVLSYHDYSDPAVVLPGDQWNGMATRLRQAAQIGKPIINGEEGIMAGTASGCMTDAQRVPLMLAKIEGQMQAGSSGVLVWDWMPAVAAPCDWDVAPGDPLLAALATVPREGP